MHRILFVCHGNICRSPMAEFIMKDAVRRAGCARDFEIASAATSTEELGHDTHPGTKQQLDAHGIPHTPRRARQLTAHDGAHYDLLIGMDGENRFYMRRICGTDAEHKIHLLLEYCGESRDVADPWYTGNFTQTFADIDRGCRALLAALTKQ
ncbi:MAG: low molecular weight phosphotyrosine protein phosphatase [Treponema sp.]|nr:low molecular weight phosphotyrosine protein phosphatase [Treponema sp.]